jgi:uncharacterized protein
VNLTQDMLEDFARGAAFLGTGGGGDPYLGRLFCEAALEQYACPELLPVDRIADDALVLSVAMMGAPTVIVEKMFSMDDAHLAVSTMERHLGREADVIVAMESGGVNATLPIAYAARRGLPLADADGMGRCFPGLHMVSFNVYGISCAPMSLVNEHGEVIMIDKARSAQACEEMARPLVSQMGAATMVSIYPMSGAELKRTAVRSSMSIALGIGQSIARGRRTGNPLDSLVSFLRSTDGYNQAYTLFSGKITDLKRETSRGWTLGACTIEALRGGDSSVFIQFQNEFLSVTQGNRELAMVPDLISIVDSETAEPIPAESLRYGQRVTVIGVSAPPIMRTPEALAVFGPRCFGLGHDFTPVEALAAIEID